MARTLTSDYIGSPPAPPHDGGDGGDGGGSGPGGSRRAAFTALLVLLAATTMVFAALTSAYAVLRGSETWTAPPLPPVLWVNTVVLLVSSAFLEIALQRLKSGRRAAFNRWWLAATACGLLFLLGQGAAWRELRDGGIYLSANPGAAFFYLLTAAHAFHLLGGVTALVYVGVRALRFELGPGRRTAADIGALFWHFLDALWLYLLALLSFWG